MIRILTSAALGAALLFQTSPVLAQAQCGPTPDVAPQLLAQHGEVPTVRMLSAKGVVMVIFVNPRSGGYTLIIERPDGLSCLIDAGDSFEGIGEQPRPFMGDGSRRDYR